MFLCPLLSPIQGDKETAQELIVLAMSDLQQPQPPFTQNKGTKSQTAQCSSAKPASSSTSTQHPITGARASLMQARLKSTSFSNAAAERVTLAGCKESLAQRRLSQTGASTSQGAGAQKAGTKGSRGSRPSRAITGTGRSTRSTRGKVDLTVDEEINSESQLGIGEDDHRERLVVLEQAQLLLQAYYASHGDPLLHR